MKLIRKRKTQQKAIFPRDKIQLFPELVPAIVEEAISPKQPGRVKCQGSYWSAKLYHPDCQVTLEPSQKALAVGIEGITLLMVTD
ncbi:NfeD family protein [Phormidium sp. CCY1219]|uniref:NfeD family protein n=1 Tax=Phormidium sp. CCY1219 TaxID=2886104 RepID=UPI002D1EA864|nr:NfeD family protein [Phormidium sp. CCY1219]MEB3830181.1 NfeD family protein [Phormidium sp. CCY1219]